MVCPGANVGVVEMILYSDPGKGVPQDMALLADEMREDPQCRMVAIGADDAGAVMVTLWADARVAEEVAESFGRFGGSVRRLTVPDGLVAW
jgi:hypothetical protein